MRLADVWSQQGTKHISLSICGTAPESSWNLKMELDKKLDLF